MNTIEITQALIRIPSYVDKQTNEQQIAEWIFTFLQQFSFLTVEKQYIDDQRFNVVATSAGEPRLLLAGHMDTVEPKQGNRRDPFNPIIENGKLYGLGSYDMKGGIAAILASLQDIQNPSGLVLLFYCDEEYDFAGMKTFLAQQQSTIAELAIVAEPSNLQIWNAHRGLIEISFALRGKTGHASNPENGKNAISGMMKTLSQLQTWLQQFETPSLGAPSLNVAYIQGGLSLGKKENTMQLGKQGNNIADYAECVIDIRTTSPDLKANTVSEYMQRCVEEQQLQLDALTIRHDLGALCTDPTELRRVEDVLQVVSGEAVYRNPEGLGYGDGQMIWERFNVPVINLGPTGAGMHAQDEYVEVDSLEQLRNMYLQIINEYCS